MTRLLPGHLPHKYISESGRWKPPMSRLIPSRWKRYCSWSVIKKNVCSSPWFENFEAILFGTIYIIATIAEVSLVKALTYEGK